jgi:hypothetical protein
MEGCEIQLNVLKDILNSFAIASSLKVNFSKSAMVPINTLENKMALLSST